jgi:PhnB protein
MTLSVAGGLILDSTPSPLEDVMASRLNPYLNFRDSAREAIEFYQSVFGGELNISTFGEMQASEDPAEADKIMHSQLETTAGYTIMAADVPASMPFQEGSNGTLSLSGDDEAELRGYFEQLAGSGSTIMPLEKAPWGDYFGMCSDRFGVSWLVNIAGPDNQPG